MADKPAILTDFQNYNWIRGNVEMIHAFRRPVYGGGNKRVGACLLTEDGSVLEQESGFRILLEGMGV